MKLIRFSIYYLLVISIFLIGYSVYLLIFDSWASIAVPYIGGCYSIALAIGLVFYFTGVLFNERNNSKRIK